MKPTRRQMERAANRYAKLIADEMKGCTWCAEYPQNTHNIGMTHDGWMDLVAALRGRARLSSRGGTK